jgi:hypothetical protein
MAFFALTITFDLDLTHEFFIGPGSCFSPAHDSRHALCSMLYAL